MKTIPLTKGKNAIVDDDDFECINQWKWCVNAYGYAVSRTINWRKVTFMHRLIMSTPKGMNTDHINGDKLDNRKCNLRICTQVQNTMNQKPRKSGTSKYKGVSYFKRDSRWRAVISNFGKYTHIGYFDTEEDAALAYNEAALKYHKEFAKLNII